MLLRQAMLVVGHIAECNLRVVVLEGTVWLGGDCSRIELRLLGGGLLRGTCVYVVSAWSNVGLVLSG